MELLLVGRIVQGAAGGLLAGLGYAVINSALPQSLWTKASALVSAMWGVGTLLGPAAGGLFAQFGSWRWAFGVLAVLTVAMAVLVPFALPGRRPSDEPSDAADRIPGVVAAAARAPRRWRSAWRASRATSPSPLALLVVGVAAGRRVPGGRPPVDGFGVAAQRLSARPAEVDLPHARPADGGDDGGHVRAAVRSAAGAPGAGGGGIPRRGSGGRLDGRRDHQRLGDQVTADRADRGGGARW